MEPTGGEVEQDVVVEHVVFTSDDGAFSVVRVAAEAGGSAFVAAGRFPIHLAEGDPLAVTGRFEEHPRFGRRFKVAAARPRLPVTEDGIRRYLRSGRIRGIGPKLAERLVDAFGTDTLRVLEDEPDRLLTVTGVGKARLEELVRVFSEGKEQRDTLVFLQGLGLGPAVSQEIWQRVGGDTLGRVRNDPWGLADDVAGVGFLTADRIAGSLGLAGDHPARLRAGLQHVLNEGLDAGHVCCAAPGLVARAAELLSIAEGVVEGALENAVASRALLSVAPGAEEVSRVYLPVMLKAEVEVAARMLALAKAPAPRVADRLPFDSTASLALTSEQESAVRLLLSSRVSVLSGGPGVGKTTVLRLAVEAWRQAGLKVALASPTGRAARRLAEAAGHGASTLHKLFGLIPGAPSEGKTLGADVLVIDETSMLDLPLFVRVLRRVPDGTSLVLVGDPDQLPSVGPGSVLADVLASEQFPTARLTRVFRQAEGSRIIENAHRINRGETPAFPAQGEPGDCFFVAKDTAEAAAEMIQRLFLERIPARFGIDPRSGIQVLSPMHRGAVGTEALNRRLSEALNGGRKTLERGNRTFREGDRVMQTRNDYDVDVMNGDMGVVIAVDIERSAVEVDFYGRRVTLDKGHLDDLEPAFAVTVHKAQGGEFPAVILPLLGEHYLMLKRNVLYTAVTRAQRVLVIVGTHRALHQSIRDDRMTRRGGELLARLQGRALIEVPPVAGT